MGLLHGRCARREAAGTIWAHGRAVHVAGPTRAASCVSSAGASGAGCVRRPVPAAAWCARAASRRGACAGTKLLWALLTAAGPAQSHTAPWLHRLWCTASRSQPLTPPQQGALQQLRSAAKQAPDQALLLLPLPALGACAPLAPFSTTTAALMATTGMAVSLAGAMEEHGPVCSSSEQTFRDLIKAFSTISEQDVAEVLGMLARTLDPKATPVRPRVSSFWATWQTASDAVTAS